MDRKKHKGQAPQHASKQTDKLASQDAEHKAQHDQKTKAKKKKKLDHDQQKSPAPQHASKQTDKLANEAADSKAKDVAPPPEDSEQCKDDISKGNESDQGPTSSEDSYSSDNGFLIKDEQVHRGYDDDDWQPNSQHSSSDDEHLSSSSESDDEDQDEDGDSNGDDYNKLDMSDKSSFTSDEGNIPFAGRIIPKCALTTFFPPQLQTQKSVLLSHTKTCLIRTSLNRVEATESVS